MLGGNLALEERANYSNFEKKRHVARESLDQQIDDFKFVKEAPFREQYQSA
jgi:hypothetical protein